MQTRYEPAPGNFEGSSGVLLVRDSSQGGIKTIKMRTPTKARENHGTPILAQYCDDPIVVKFVEKM